jgi:DNA-directed RNA polymerase II subunit RPB2
LEDEEPKRFDIRFDQIYLSTPTHWEKDGTTSRLTPYEARIRGITYADPLYVDMFKLEFKTSRAVAPGFENDNIERDDPTPKVFLGKIPIMLRSKYCSLHDLSDRDLYEFNNVHLTLVGIF